MCLRDRDFYLGAVVVVVLGAVVVVVLGAVVVVVGLVEGTASVVVPVPPVSEVPRGNSVVVFGGGAVGSFVWATVKGWPVVWAYAGMAMTSPAAIAK